MAILRWREAIGVRGLGNILNTGRSVHFYLHQKMNCEMCYSKFHYSMLKRSPLHSMRTYFSAVLRLD